MINEVNKRFLKFSFNGENRSIDESMILYYETHSSSQRINNKPIRVGHNIWFFAEKYGYVVQLEPHQCVKKGKQAVSSFKWGLGEKDVLRLIECLSLMLGIIYLWITISQLFILVCFTTLELATFEQQVKSTKMGYLGTLNSAYQAKRAVQLWQWLVGTTKLYKALHSFF